MRKELHEKEAEFRSFRGASPVPPLEGDDALTGAALGHLQRPAQLPMMPLNTRKLPEKPEGSVLCSSPEAGTSLLCLLWSFELIKARMIFPG